MADAKRVSRRVLLVDDSAITLDVARSHLQSNGFDVRSATTIWDFQKELRRFQPDIIIADVNMPGMTGPDLCRRLQAELPRMVPVILFSSLDDAELATLAESSGAHGYLSKRHGLDRLTKELEVLCESILW